MQIDMPKAEEKMFFIQIGEGSKWFGFKRQVKKLPQHHNYCFGINHLCFSGDHQLYMLDVVTEVNQDEKDDSFMEKIGATSVEESGILKNINDKQTLKRKIPKYYDKQQQLELVLANQELSEFSDHDSSHTDFDEKEKCWTDTKDIDI
jgi:hypothetical protein